MVALFRLTVIGILPLELNNPHGNLLTHGNELNCKLKGVREGKLA